jgi:hypothetical protein
VRYLGDGWIYWREDGESIERLRFDRWISAFAGMTRAKVFSLNID